MKFNAAFWKWFGNSKVVDDKGRPLVVYHGTDREFNKFSKSAESSTDDGYYGKGFYFTPEYGTAEDYGSIIKAVFLKIENPFMVMATDDQYYATNADLASHLTDAGMDAPRTGVGPDQFNFIIKKLKFDGIIVSHKDNKYAYEYVVFEPNQIKLVKNDGTWDVGDPDIRSNPSTFWVRAGAGVLFTCAADRTMMLVKRSRRVLQPGTWGITGGSCDGEEMFGEDEGREVSNAEAWECAKKETLEEIGYFPKKYRVVGEVVFQQDRFTYTTFIVDVDPVEKERLYQNADLNFENDDLVWRKINKVVHTESDLHFGVKYILESKTWEKINRG